MDTIECPVCGYPSAEKQATYDPVTVFYMCPVCGRYEFSETERMRPSLDKTKLASFFIIKAFGEEKIYPLNTDITQLYLRKSAMNM